MGRARVQALLTARNQNKDKGRKRPHHLKGSLFCARCGRRFGITVAKKSNGNAFYCLGRQHDTQSCLQGYVAVGDVEDAVRAYWAQVRLPQERIRALRQSVVVIFRGKRDRGQAEIQQQKRRIAELEQRRKKAKAAYYADVLPLEEFRTEQETIRIDIKSAEDIIAYWSVELDGITQGLNDALRLVENPQSLYDAMPDGHKVLLIQTIFDKIWIVNTNIVGCELTAPFAELLTLEAQLAQKKQESEATYYRRRATILTLSHLSGSWERPSIERPYGALTIDEKNPDALMGRSSNFVHLAGVGGFKLNPELSLFLQTHNFDRNDPNSKAA